MNINICSLLGKCKLSPNPADFPSHLTGWKCVIWVAEVSVSCTTSPQLFDFMHLWWTVLCVTSEWFPIVSLCFSTSGMSLKPEDDLGWPPCNGAEGLNNSLVLQGLRLSSSFQGVSLLSYLPFPYSCFSISHASCSLLLGITPTQKVSKLHSVGKLFPLDWCHFRHQSKVQGSLGTPPFVAGYKCGGFSTITLRLGNSLEWHTELWWYGLNVCVRPNPSVKILIFNVMVSGGEGFGGGPSQGCSPDEWDSCSYRRDPRELSRSFSITEDTAEVGSLPSRRRFSLGPDHVDTLISDF